MIGLLWSIWNQTSSLFRSPLSNEELADELLVLNFNLFQKFLEEKVEYTQFFLPTLKNFQVIIGFFFRGNSERVNTAATAWALSDSCAGFSTDTTFATSVSTQGSQDVANHRCLWIDLLLMSVLQNTRTKNHTIKFFPHLSLPSSTFFLIFCQCLL